RLTRSYMLYAFDFLLFLPCVTHRNSPSFPTRRSSDLVVRGECSRGPVLKIPPEFNHDLLILQDNRRGFARTFRPPGEHQRSARRSEEHTSELQSRENLVCRLLLEKKKKYK